MEFAPFLLRVETLTGYSFEVVARRADTIEHIKSRVAFQEGIGHRNFHLIYGSRELRDQQTVGSLGLNEGSCIKLVLSLRGGPVATKRIQLPPINIATSCEWLLQNDDISFDQDLSIVGSIIDLNDLDCELLESRENGNGTRTIVLVVNDSGKNANSKALPGQSSRSSNGRQSKRKRNKTTKSEASNDEQESNSSARMNRSAVKRIRAEIANKNNQTCAGQPPYKPKQLVKYVRAKLQEERDTGNPLLLPTISLKNGNQSHRKLSRPISATTRNCTVRKMRCDQCGKKLGPTTTFPCHCGLLFCPIHRNAEEHNCSFDYKTEGKRLLRQTNPVVDRKRINRL